MEKLRKIEERNKEKSRKLNNAERKNQEKLK